VRDLSFKLQYLKPRYPLHCPPVHVLVSPLPVLVTHTDLRLICGSSDWHTKIRGRLMLRLRDDPDDRDQTHELQALPVQGREKCYSFCYPQGASAKYIKSMLSNVRLTSLGRRNPTPTWYKTLQDAASTKWIMSVTELSEIATP
jgi:hypothetical protein